jgi:hypothetical protein
MKLAGEYILTAPPEAVWRALNDPDVLRQALPGCQSLEQVGEHAFKATVGARIGPMQATFNGEVTLSDLDPPRGYTITGAGSGGVAGAAKGSAKVRLEPHEQGTRLTYDADAQVTGKMAQLGSRLIDATAGMMAGQFFGKFQEIVGKPAPTAAAAGSGKPPAAGLPQWVWLAVGFAVATLLSLVILMR